MQRRQTETWSNLVRCFQHEFGDTACRVNNGRRCLGDHERGVVVKGWRWVRESFATSTATVLESALRKQSVSIITTHHKTGPGAGKYRNTLTLKAPQSVGQVKPEENFNPMNRNCRLSTLPVQIQLRDCSDFEVTGKRMR